MKFLHLLCFSLLCLFAFSCLHLLSAQEAEVTGLCRLTEDHNLLSGPGRNYKVVRKASQGLLLQIIGEKVGYYRVRVPDGFHCYIAADYLEVDSRHMGLVTGSRVNLRSIPRVEGDYPIFKVDEGTRLRVWDRVSDWYRVTAPEEAYAYALKTAALPVVSDADTEAEIQALHAQREIVWLQHHNALVEALEQAKHAKAMDELYKRLEGAAAKGFEGEDLAQTLADYKTVAEASPDEEARKLAAVRIKEVEALVAKAEAEEALKHKEANWQKEKGELKATLTQSRKANSALEKQAPKGREVTVIGTVEATDAGVVLRGGKTVYRISCPDERYLLADFHGKRIRALGRSIASVSRDTAPLVFVERIEILK